MTDTCRSTSSRPIILYITTKFSTRVPGYWYTLDTSILNLTGKIQGRMHDEICDDNQQHFEIVVPRFLPSLYSNLVSFFTGGPVNFCQLKSVRSSKINNASKYADDDGLPPPRWRSNTPSR